MKVVFLRKNDFCYPLQCQGDYSEHYIHEPAKKAFYVSTKNCNICYNAYDNYYYLTNLLVKYQYLYRIFVFYKYMQLCCGDLNMFDPGEIALVGVVAMSEWAWLYHCLEYLMP